MARDEVRGRLLLEYVLENNPGLMEQLLDDPGSVLERLGVDEETLKCTEEAHRRKPRARTRSARGRDPVELLPQLGATAREKLGSDLTVAKVPFGIRFSERVQDFRLGNAISYVKCWTRTETPSGKTVTISYSKSVSSQ